ncbi:MAG: hypothetical protein ACLSTO_11535 [Bilophila wadsworthia]
MKKQVGGFLAILLAATLAGCSSGGKDGEHAGYEGTINSACQALQSGEVEALTALLDMESIEKGLEALHSNGENATAQIRETLTNLAEQEAFVHTCDDLAYDFGKDYIVEHGGLFPDEEAIDLELFQRLRKLESEDETLTQTEFINSFVDSLSDVMVVETTIIIRSADAESKSRLDVTLWLYERDETWYLDNASLSDIQTPNILGTVGKALLARDQ